MYPFKNSPKIYNYSYYNVRWLSNPLWIDPTHSKVFINGTLQKQVKEIWKFESDEQNYLRIIFNNNFILDDVEGNILVTSSCLEEKESKDTFSYLRNVAYINPLGKAEHSDGILRDMYDKCDFIGDDTAAACYLNPKKHKPKAFRKRRLIYPFGCNSSLHVHLFSRNTGYLMTLLDATVAKRKQSAMPSNTKSV